MPPTPLRPLAAPAFRLGVLVPPANPTVEIEYPALLPEGAVMHSMRLPVIAGDLATRNQGYIACYAQSLSGFGSLKLDAIAIAMTGSQYHLGYQGDVALCERLSQQAGLPVVTASLALCRTLQALHIEQISLLSPYPDWLTELASQYWQSAGFQVAHIQRFQDALVAYSVTPADINTQLQQLTCPEQGTIVLSGTGMLTLDSLLALKANTAQPIISSNLCSVWQACQHLKLAPSRWMQAVLPNKLL